MSNCIINCLNWINQNKNGIVLDANIELGNIEKLVEGGYIIMLPQTYCFDYIVSIINQVASKIARNLRDSLRSGLRQVSRNMLEQMIEATTTREYIHRARICRKLSAKNRVLICNLTRQCAEDTIKIIKKRFRISETDYDKLIRDFDHFYIALFYYLKCRLGFDDIILISNDNLINRVLRTVNCP